VPRKIRIPAIKVDTFVEQVGITAEGNMDVPKNIWNTAWLRDGGYRPGQAGNAVIAGHLDAPGTAAVFWDLDKLKLGDKLYITDAAGKELTFQVVDRQFYPYNNAPLVKIFGPSTEPRLNLITCGGVFDRASHSYDQRLIVFTKLVS
jgi:LPXTG-site transpeptidase (sortase) family protein